MSKKLLGHVGVDSGQLMVTDPCYIKMYKNNEFNSRIKLVNVKDETKILVYPDDFKNFLTIRLIIQYNLIQYKTRQN